MLVAALSVWVAAPAPGSIALVGLEGLGLDPSVVQSFERLLERTLDDITGGQVLGPAEIDFRLGDPALGRLRACRGEAACLVDLGGILETGRVLYGTLTRLGDSYILSLRLIDVAAGREAARVQETLRGGDSEVIAALRGTATKVVDPAQYAGALLISCDVPGCSATLDGAPVPVGTRITTTVGTHAVTVSAEGRRTHNAAVEITFGDVALLDARLAAGDYALQRSGGISWWQITGVTGIAALAAGGVFGALLYREEQLYADHYQAADRQPRFFERRRDDGERYALYANIALVAGSALFGSGVVGWVLEDR